MKRVKMNSARRVYREPVPTADRFNRRAFRKYCERIAEQTIEEIENHYPAQQVASEFPGYNAEWCAEDFTTVAEMRRREAMNAIASYLMNTYLANKFGKD